MGCARRAEIQEARWKDEPKIMKEEATLVTSQNKHLDDDNQQLKNAVDLRDALLLAKEEEIVKLMRKVDTL